MQRDVPPVSAAPDRGQAGGTLVVNEVFFSIQGEGTRAGRPCAFVRLTGCPLRCVWCDTAYAFHEGRRREMEDVLGEIAALPTRLLCLTGGEPLAQPGAFDLVRLCLDAGWEVAVETSGHVDVAPLDSRASAILDVKTPGSGESHRMHWPNLDRLAAKDEAKFVIDGRADYEWSRGLVRERRLAERTTVLFSPVHGVLDAGALARWILDDGLAVRLQVQLHKLLWPQATRGV
jgi:7-carboxy-7-deazaguanine synthase